MDKLDETIAKKLAEKVKNGAISIADVPPLYKARVEELLNE